MGSLLEEIRTAAVRNPRPGILDKIRGEMSEQDFADFLAALNDVSISSRAIAGVMRNRGIRVSDSWIVKYRRERR